MTMKLKPLDDRVVVRVQDSDERTPGGIVLPDVAKERPQLGEVLEVGPGRLLEDGTRAPCAVKQGDVIMFTKYAGTELKVGGELVSVMAEGEILAVIES